MKSRMRVVHNINANSNDAFKEALDREGIPYESEESALGAWVRLRVSEDDGNWTVLKELISEHEPLDLAHVEY